MKRLISLVLVLFFVFVGIGFAQSFSPIKTLNNAMWIDVSAMDEGEQGIAWYFYNNEYGQFKLRMRYVDLSGNEVNFKPYIYEGEAIYSDGQLIIKLKNEYKLSGDNKEFLGTINKSYYYNANFTKKDGSILLIVENNSERIIFLKMNG